MVMTVIQSFTKTQKEKSTLVMTVIQSFTKTQKKNSIHHDSHSIVDENTEGINAGKCGYIS